MTEANARRSGGVAIVLSGAGARGAYEAGALSVLLPLMKGEDTPTMVLGTSAGALNTAMLASVLSQGVDEAARAVVEGWKQITPKAVFSTPRKSLLLTAWRLLRRSQSEASFLLDTAPLRHTLARILADENYGCGVAQGALDAVAIVASSCATARAVVFVETNGHVPSQAPGIDYVGTTLGLDHLMASSAFPIAFPAQWVDGPVAGWYMDGGIHLNTPLKPAIDLGADRVLVVGATPWYIDRPPNRSKAPSFMDGSGQLLQAMNVDTLRADLASLQRVNASLGAGHPPPPASGPTPRIVEFCNLNPTNDDLSDAAARILPKSVWRTVRSFLGYPSLGWVAAQRQRPGQFLSYLCFEQEFIDEAILCGITDATKLVGNPPRIPWFT